MCNHLNNSIFIKGNPHMRPTNDSNDLVSENAVDANGNPRRLMRFPIVGTTDATSIYVSLNDIDMDAFHEELFLTAFHILGLQEGYNFVQRYAEGVNNFLTHAFPVLLAQQQQQQQQQPQNQPPAPRL